MSIEQQVIDFHEKFCPEKIATGVGQELIPQAEVEFRLGFIEEELNELKDALAAGDLGEELDAYVDILWVVYGTMLMRFGKACSDEAMAEVYRANMSKVRVPGNFKIQKPADFVRPDIHAVVDRHRTNPTT